MYTSGMVPRETVSFVFPRVLKLTSFPWDYTSSALLNI